MAVTLTPEETASLLPDAPQVYLVDITVARERIEDDFGQTLDTGFSGVSDATKQLALAVVAVAVRRTLNNLGGEAVVSETDGDYSYNESATLAQATRFARVTTGARELLEQRRAQWSHI